MKMPTPWTPAGQRHINAFAPRARLLHKLIYPLFSELELLQQVGFSLLHELTKRSPLFGRYAADRFLARRQRAFLSEMPGPQIRQRALLRFCFVQSQARFRHTCAGKACKAFELLLERFACFLNLKFWIQLYGLVCHQQSTS